VIAAVASATPSTTPMVTMEAPRTVVMKIGSRLWISSDEISMNIEPSPNAQMPIGKARNVAGAPVGGCEPFEGGGFMGDAIAGCLTKQVNLLAGHLCHFASSVQR
jgi:hypothetical protein